MKKFLQKITYALATVMMGLCLLPSTFNTVPVSATSGPVVIADGGAAILTDCYKEGENSKNGAGISCVIRLVVNILSVLVGILGIIGIVVVGIQYLTAGGNEEQTRKAKRRLFEIVIGIVVFVLMAALLNWLLPGFDKSNNNSNNKSYVPTLLATTQGV